MSSPSADQGAVTIVDRPEQNRYELRLDGQVRGLVVYCDADHVRALVHTEVDAAVQGRGLAAELVRHALDDARRDGRQVHPACPYVAYYIERHPEFAPLVAAG